MFIVVVHLATQAWILASSQAYATERKETNISNKGYIVENEADQLAFYKAWLRIWNAGLLRNKSH